ncbi:MAG: DUF3107 family protein [Actinobacteria bacterium]|nr:MAG: DUF3107 family protein [Actinomycetota bacterium]
MSSRERLEEGYDLPRNQSRKTNMKVRIGVAESNKVIELEVEDVEAFKKKVGTEVEEGAVLWFTDTKGREVGIPSSRLAFVEVESQEQNTSVGFAPVG